MLMTNHFLGTSSGSESFLKSTEKELKFKLGQARQGERILTFESIKSIADGTGVYAGDINSCLSGNKIRIPRHFLSAQIATSVVSDWARYGKYMY